VAPAAIRGLGGNNFHSLGKGCICGVPSKFGALGAYIRFFFYQVWWILEIVLDTPKAESQSAFIITEGAGKVYLVYC